MDITLLQILWGAVIGLAVIFYTILDGFDMGVGTLLLFTKEDQERRLFLNAIGPVWDGNEVWLVIVLGGTFAGFPAVYAAALTGFYTIMMILIASLMLRAAAMEFRSKSESKRWRLTWDLIFSIASYLIAFIFGLLLGNFIRGVPMNAEHIFIGGFWDLFHPYAILTGLTAVAIFTMHGAIYLAMKTEGDLHEKVRKWVNHSIIIFIIFYIITTIATWYYMPHMIDMMKAEYLLYIVPVLAFVAIISIPFQILRGKNGWAFLSSCASIALLLAVFACGRFPYLIHSTIDPLNNSLTIYNSSSSEKTLGILLIIVIIGVPMVLAYGFWIYRIFRGKVKLDSTSY